MKREGAHSVLESSWCNCRKCHRGVCHSHFLQQSKVHAQQSLLFCEADGTHGLAHEKHLESRALYPKDDLLALQELQIEDGQPGHRFQLACLALNFKAARPLRPRFAQGGFYDELPEVRTMVLSPPQCTHMSLDSTTTSRRTPISERQCKRTAIVQTSSVHHPFHINPNCNPQSRAHSITP